MTLTKISPTVFAKDVDRAKKFYTTHFNAKVAFDCGWYVSLEFGQNGPAIQFMQPQSPEQKEYQGGLTLNLCLEDTGQVDAMHERMVEAGLPIVMPLENHPWGDRAFSTLDPYGVTLYIYADTEPTEEFKQYFK